MAEVAVALRQPKHWLELTEDDLPCEDGEPVESKRHYLQRALLQEPLEHFWAGRQDVFIGADQFLYFMEQQTNTRYFRGPDLMVVTGAVRKERKSWVVWQEGKVPDLVIELLSDETRRFDQTEKKRIYQDHLKAPEYYWYDPFSKELAGFRLVDGLYQPIEPDSRGRLVSRQIGLALALWDGQYGELSGTWVRWETLEGQILPTGFEAAEQERERADRLAAQLRAMGIVPEG